MKIERTTIDIIYEIKEILDEKEKEYLSSVIRPFRNRIKYIIKFNDNQEWLMIRLNDDQPIIFPYFEANTMYKGMEEGKEYTLEELGL